MPQSWSAFDVIGPVMVGPSSSHTAGAVKIGYFARIVNGQQPKKVKLMLHGSFGKVYKGHCTDKAIVGGLLGYLPDSEEINNALELAKEAGMEVSLKPSNLGDTVHPNSVRIEMKNEDGSSHRIRAKSIGGGKIVIREIDKVVFYRAANGTGVMCRLESDNKTVPKGPFQLEAVVFPTIADPASKARVEGDLTNKAIAVSLSRNSNVVARMRKAGKLTVGETGREIFKWEIRVRNMDKDGTRRSSWRMMPIGKNMTLVRIARRGKPGVDLLVPANLPSDPNDIEPILIITFRAALIRIGKPGTAEDAQAGIRGMKRSGSKADISKINWRENEDGEDEVVMGQ